jgi:hypothetical protein
LAAIKLLLSYRGQALAADRFEAVRPGKRQIDLLAAPADYPGDGEITYLFRTVSGILTYPIVLRDVTTNVERL